MVRGFVAALRLLPADARRAIFWLAAAIIVYVAGFLAWSLWNAPAGDRYARFIGLSQDTIAFGAVAMVALAIFGAKHFVMKQAMAGESPVRLAKLKRRADLFEARGLRALAWDVRQATSSASAEAAILRWRNLPACMQCQKLLKRGDTNCSKCGTPLVVCGAIINSVPW